jgi:hypothetical protein
MFPRMNIANPFQSFAFGVPQYGMGFGGINPIVPNLAPPYGSYPIAPLTGIGVNPYALGQSQYVHPLLVAQLPTTNPTLMPLLTQHPAIGQSPYGIWGNSFGQGVSPLSQQGWGQQGWGQQFGGGIGQFGSPLSLHTFPQQAFGYPALQQGFGWGAQTPFNAPVLGIDPITGALIAQQPSLPAQSQLPIRPLITPQQPDPFQMAALNGVTQYGSPTTGVPF